MRTKLPALLGFFVILGLCIPGALAASPCQVNGEHYNLTIIGVKSSKDVGASDGHTMFVLLNGKTRITMTQDPLGQFYVTDRNGTDGTASFNIAAGHYNVYARAPGKPNGNVKIQANGTFNDSVIGETEYMLGYVDISRTKGKPAVLNINELFYVTVNVCTAVDSGGLCTASNTYENVWVFDIPELLSYYWDYTNTGLKNLQVRFYECTLDATGTAPDFCRDKDGTPIVSKVNGEIV